MYAQEKNRKRIQGVPWVVFITAWLTKEGSKPVSPSESMDKQHVAKPPDGMAFGHEKGRILIHTKTVDKSQSAVLNEETCQVTHHKPIYRKYPERISPWKQRESQSMGCQNPGDRKTGADGFTETRLLFGVMRLST